jgi:Right handed beta helix region
MNRSVINTLAAGVLVLALTPMAHAQATRTWVSGVGDDANPCSRTAPCKTFAGAISKTATFGEISVLDPGGFGVVTIVKAITISGDGTLAGILSAGTNGVIVNITNPAMDGPVVLRNLSINGANTGLNGIRYLAGKALVVQDCTITGVTQNGIDVSLAADGNLVVSRTSIAGGATGVRVNTTSGRVDGSLDHVSIQHAGDGIHAVAGFVNVSNSNLSQNTANGIVADSGAAINVEGSMFTGNGVAVQSNVGGTVRLSNSDFLDNQTGFGCGGGTLATAGNNRKANNVGGGAACTPNATFTVQ